MIGPIARLRGLLTGLIMANGAVTAAVMLYIAIPPPRAQLYPEFNSYRIYDRRGELLREILSKNYTTSVWLPVSEISPYLIISTILREDKRFFAHPGVDVMAITRALFQNIKQGDITSGGSTISMQVAKFTLNIKDRGLIAKIREIIFALKLELHLDKSKILEIYLNRAPYGNLNYGVESASRFYFDKKSIDISWGEAALLSCLPQAPSLNDPYRNPERVKIEKDRLLDQLFSLGYIDEITYELAKFQQVRELSGRPAFKAPHFTDYIENQIDRSNIENPTAVLTTLDYNLPHNI